MLHLVLKSLNYLLKNQMLTASFIPEKPVDKLLHKLRSDEAKKYVKPGAIVCDLGCGLEGNFLKKNERIIGKGFGFDLFVSDKSNNDKIKLQALDLNAKIPLPDSSVDLVTAMAVLEHLNNYEIFIKEIYRILKKDGTLVLSTPTKLIDPIIKTLGFLGLIDNDEAHDHKMYFNTKQLTELFRNSGFTDIKVKKFQLGFNQLAIGQK